MNAAQLRDLAYKAANAGDHKLAAELFGKAADVYPFPDIPGSIAALDIQKLRGLASSYARISK